MELGILIAAAAAVWVYKDATDRGSSSAVGWAVGVFFLLIVFLPLYLLRRPPKKLAEEMPYGAPPINHAQMQSNQPMQQKPPVLPPQEQEIPMPPTPQPSMASHAPVLTPTPNPSPASSPMPVSNNTKEQSIHANTATENTTLCPNCGQYFEKTMNFCPHCGAKNKT